MFLGEKQRRKRSPNCCQENVPWYTTSSFASLSNQIPMPPSLSVSSIICTYGKDGFNTLKHHAISYN